MTFFLMKGTDMETAEISHPYLDVNVVEGGNRQGVPYDSWAIMIKGLPTTEFNRAGEQLVETIPKTEGYGAVLKRLREVAEEQNLLVAGPALAA